MSRVIWITGLSGAGKTTLAKEVVELLNRLDLGSVIALDGDELRLVFGSESRGHSYRERYELAMSYSRLCKVLSDQGCTVVISTISMFHEVQDWNRKNLIGYFEALLDVPLDVLKARDSKQIYSRYNSGLTNNVTGLDIEAEFPVSPHWKYSCERELNPQELARDLVKCFLGKDRGSE